MVLVKFIKSKNKIFNALSMGTANSDAYNVVVDKKVVATLHPGMEAEVSLQPGTHKVFFKIARFGGYKSNKLTVNIEPNKDYAIEALRNMSGITASCSTLQPKSDAEFINVICICGAPNKVIKGKSTTCEYCGNTINS